MKTNEERLQDLFSYLGNLSHVKADEIPDIDLYMDQVTTFMDSHLKDMRRHPGDKVLTKTMINNYAKNNLLPPPVKKKYSKDHMLMLVFIYYFKNLLSFSDIEELSVLLHQSISQARHPNCPWKISTTKYLLWKRAR